MKAQRATEGGDDVYDEDDVLDPREKARRDKERELNSDLNNAADLFGAAALGGMSCSQFLPTRSTDATSLFHPSLTGTSSKELDSLLSFEPRTKEDFQDFSRLIIEYILKRHQSKPLYASFVEYHARELAAPLKDVEVRKAASGLTTLANEKQKEAREKASGKKKSKAASKPALGSSKMANK